MYYFKQVENGNIISIESKNVDVKSPGFVKATKAEYDGFHASLPPTNLVEPPRDLLAEIDELKARLDKITKINGVA